MSSLLNETQAACYVTQTQKKDSERETASKVPCLGSLISGVFWKLSLPHISCYYEIAYLSQYFYSGSWSHFPVSGSTLLKRSISIPLPSCRQLQNTVTVDHNDCHIKKSTCWLRFCSINPARQQTQSGFYLLQTQRKDLEKWKLGGEKYHFQK